MKKTLVTLLFACIAMLLGSSCVVVTTSVPVAMRTPTYCGGIKLYGTDNVPFEYEELGVLSVYSKVDGAPVEKQMGPFVTEAQKMGADAILNFMIEPASDIVLFGFGAGPCRNTYRMRGVAVRIKRP